MHSPIHCLNHGASNIILVGGTTYLSDLKCLDNWISHQSICLSTMQRRGIAGEEMWRMLAAMSRAMLKSPSLPSGKLKNGNDDPNSARKQFLWHGGK